MKTVYKYPRLYLLIPSIHVWNWKLMELQKTFGTSYGGRPQLILSLWAENFLFGKVLFVMEAITVCWHKYIFCWHKKQESKKSFQRLYITQVFLKLLWHMNSVMSKKKSSSIFYIQFKKVKSYKKKCSFFYLIFYLLSKSLKLSCVKYCYYVFVFVFFLLFIHLS